MLKGGESIFTVRSSEVDFRGQATLPVLVSYLQEAAWENTRTLGISMYDLLEKGLTWVLSRLRVEMFTYPKHNERVIVETWASGREKVFLHRDFRIYSPEGELLGQATSVWLVMDVVKRRLTAVPDFITAVELASGYEPLPFAKGKLPTLAEASPIQRFPVQWHDIDLNRHVNNTHYLRWALESLPTAVLEGQQLQEADIIFRAESTLGETVVAAAAPDQEQPGVFLHRLTEETTGKELVQAQTKWLALEKQ